MPILHDTPVELAQPLTVKEWKKGEIEAIPGKTMPALVEVERNYPDTYRKFTALGPLLQKIGNGGKGLLWNTEKNAFIRMPLTTDFGQGRRLATGSRITKPTGHIQLLIDKRQTRFMMNEILFLPPWASPRATRNKTKDKRLNTNQ